MPALIKLWYGNLTGENVAQNLPRGMQSGDVHVAVYDFATKNVFFATGTTDGPAGPYTRLACNSPFLKFKTESLWSEPKPMVVINDNVVVGTSSLFTAEPSCNDAVPSWHSRCKVACAVAPSCRYHGESCKCDPL